MKPTYVANTVNGMRTAFDSIHAQVFYDGYCNCRCGPGHHWFAADIPTPILEVYCVYHQKRCCDVRLPFMKLKDAQYLATTLGRYAEMKKLDAQS